VTAYFVLVFSVLGLITISVVLAWLWAVKTDQFSDFKKGATSIFDEDEPIGRVTDVFPDQEKELERYEAARK
jgi:cbb3-type cytochrome oxidase maturation protein